MAKANCMFLKKPIMYRLFKKYIYILTWLSLLNFLSFYIELRIKIYENRNRFHNNHASKVVTLQTNKLNGSAWGRLMYLCSDIMSRLEWKFYISFKQIRKFLQLLFPFPQWLLKSSIFYFSVSSWNKSKNQ